MALPRRQRSNSASPAIDAHHLVGAWLDAHFDLPVDANPLTRGYYCDPGGGSASVGGSFESDGRASPVLDSPPRISPLRPNSTDEDNNESAQEMMHWEGDRSGGIFPAGRLRGGALPHRTRDIPWNEEGERWGERGSQNSEFASASATPSDNGLDTDCEGETNTRSSILDFSARSSFAASLTDMAMPPPKKRKSASLSPSKGSSTYSDTRRKRQALYLNKPSGTFGIPDLADYEPEDASLMPANIIAILNLFSTGNFEIACIPQTPEIDVLLRKSFPHERIPAHARLDLTTSHGADQAHALALITFAIDTHRACLRNSRVGEDEAAWYPLVRSLLCVEPPPLGSTSIVARPPRHAYNHRWTVNDLFITIDATTKATTTSLAPTHATVKLDALLAFNRDHADCKRVVRTALDAGIRLNAFTDPLLAGTLVVLGVEVKSTGGAGGEMEAEYQLAVWGMKTLALMHELSPKSAQRCVLGVSVCGHVWSLHVTYWREGEMVTHGPVGVGATDTLYGTMKVVAFVKLFKQWAQEVVLPEWEELVRVSAASGESEGVC